MKFLLRIDDTDLERSKQIYEDEIKRDLEWLELNGTYMRNNPIDLKGISMFLKI